MSETPNYKLFIYDDDQMTFREWRLKLNGENNSNILKIDKVLGEKPGKILDNGWVGSEVFNDYENNIANASYAHAEGNGTTSSGHSSHSEGTETEASGTSSHAEGRNSKAADVASHAEGLSTNATNTGSHSEGTKTEASGTASHAEGSSTTASGDFSHSEGKETMSAGYAAHSEGWEASATGIVSHAEGAKTLSAGDYSHVEGYGNISRGIMAHSQGFGTRATSRSIDVIGEFNLYTEAILYVDEKSNLSFGTFENNTQFITTDSFELSEDGSEFICGGKYIYSSADSIEVGRYYICSGDSNIPVKITKLYRIEELDPQPDNKMNFWVTKFEIIDSSTNRGEYIHIIGNGNSDDDRSNAHTVDWNGNAWYSGDVYVGSASGTNKDEGSVKVATVNDIVGKSGDGNSSAVFNNDSNIAAGDYSYAQGSNTVASSRSQSVFGEYNALEDMYVLTETSVSKQYELGTHLYRFDGYSIEDGLFIGSNPVDVTAYNVRPGDYFGQHFSYISTIYKCVRKEEVWSTHTGSTGSTISEITGYRIYAIELKTAHIGSSDRGHYAHVVGNGTSENDRSNAHTIDWKGNAWFAGDVYIKSSSGTNKDGGSLRLVTEKDLEELSATVSGSIHWDQF